MSRKLYRRTVLLGLGFFLPNVATLLSSCQRQPQATASGSNSASVAPSNVTIAYQPGLTYYGLLLIKHQRILEQQFPNTTIDWKVLSGSSPMQEGMIANQIQIGSVAAPAFLVGRDRGLDWKLLSGMMLQDYWLVVNDPTIQSLKDFKPNHKIGVLAPNSIHATTLRKAAQQQLGNPNALDANLQSMTHPAGLQAFQSKQIAAHFTSAPFYWQEVDLGGRVILKSSDLFGGLNTGTALVVMEEFYNQYPAFNQALHKAVQDASKMLREQPDQAATLIAAESGGKTTAEEIKQWVIRNDVEFNTSAKGYLAYAAFLRETNQISKQPQSIDELVLPPLQGKGGN